MGRSRASQPIHPRRVGAHGDTVHQSLLAMDARRKLERGDRARMWLDGAEVGGIDRRYAHLGRSYD
jgi:hypothetical protein